MESDTSITVIYHGMSLAVLYFVTHFISLLEVRLVKLSVGDHSHFTTDVSKEKNDDNQLAFCVPQLIVKRTFKFSHTCSI